MVDSEPTSHRPVNLLEWLSARGLPDSFRAPIVALSAGFALAPYVGGATISSSITVPTVPAEAFWPLVFLTPIWWCVLVVRLIGSPALRIVGFLSGAVFLSVLSIIGHVKYPAVALNSITPSFDQTRRISFLETQHTWIASHVRDSDGDRYCHFRTRAIDLGPDVRSGCTLRIDKLAIEANGFASVPGKAAFDLEVFVSSAQMLPEVAGLCVPSSQWQSVPTPSDYAEVEGRAVIAVAQTDTVPQPELNRRLVDYSASFEFDTRKVTALPHLQEMKLVSRKDVEVKAIGARVQLAGWTFWEPPASFESSELSMRVFGRMRCGMW